jgi:hypothetical protein
MSDDDMDSVFTSADIEDFGGGCDTPLYDINKILIHWHLSLLPLKQNASAEF